MGIKEENIFVGIRLEGVYNRECAAQFLEEYAKSLRNLNLDELKDDKLHWEESTGSYHTYCSMEVANSSKGYNAMHIFSKTSCGKKD